MFLVWLHGSEATTDFVFKTLWLLKYILLKYCVLNFQELPEGQAQSWPGAGAVFLRVALVSVNTPAVLTSTTHAPPMPTWGGDSRQVGQIDPGVRRNREGRLQEAGLRTTTTYISEKASADCMLSPRYMLRKDRRRPRLASLADLWAPRSRRRWQSRAAGSPA